MTEESTPHPPSPEGEADQVRIQDKRRFDPVTGEPRPAEGIPLPGGGVLASGAPAGTQPRPIEVSFEDLVRPFLLTGLVGLGVLPHPETQKPHINLDAAQLAIETLELLRRKTEGQRSEQETRLLEEALFGLKMQFVAHRESP